MRNRLAIVALVVALSGCYRATFRLHQGPIAVYSDHGATLIVSQGYVAAAYQRWVKRDGRLVAKARLYNLCVAEYADGKWEVRRNWLWEGK
jgi:hypothetical protein